MDDLDGIHTDNRFLRKIPSAKVLRVILSIMALEQTCPNRRHTLLLLQSYEQFLLQLK